MLLRFNYCSRQNPVTCHVLQTQQMKTNSTLHCRGHIFVYKVDRHLHYFAPVDFLTFLWYVSDVNKISTK